MDENTVLYVAVAMGVAVLSFSALSFFELHPSAPSGVVALKQYAGVSPPAGGALPAGASECGDLADAKNVQHLSHHPDKYSQCLRQVDPQVLKSATGKGIREILG